MNKLEQFIIPESEDQSRLDRCLRRNLGEINQSLLEKSLRNKYILLNGEQWLDSYKEFILALEKGDKGRLIALISQSSVWRNDLRKLKTSL